MATIHCHVQIEQALEQLGLRQGSTPCTPGSAFGEANVGANVGAGEGEVYRDKVGVTLNFRTLKAGSNTTIVTSGDEITINSLAGGGDVTGPDPSTPKAIATYADATGDVIRDNKIRIDTGISAGYSERAIQALDNETTPAWHDLIGLDYIFPNGLPGGITVLVGDIATNIVIRAGDDPVIQTPSGNGYVLHEKITHPWKIEKQGQIYLPAEPATTEILQLGTGGTNGALAGFYVGGIAPQGAIWAIPGSIYIRGNTAGSDASLYQHQGAAAGTTDWYEFKPVGKLEAADVIINSVGTSPTLDDAQDSINTFGLAGATQSGFPFVTDAGSATVNVAAGYGFFRSSDSPDAAIYAGNWAASTGISIPTNTVRYLGVEYNAGSPQVTLRTLEDFDGHTDFLLASVVNEGGTLHILNNAQHCSDFGERIYHRFYETRPLERAERLGGLIPAGTGTRYLTVSGGELYDGFNEFTISPIDTSGTDTFDAYYRDGGTGWTKIAAQSQWNNTQYDDDSGTLATLGTAKYGVHWLYIEADGNLVLLFGQAQYNTLGDAENATAPALVPQRIFSHGRLLGRLTFLKDATSPSSVSNVWEAVFAGTVSGGDVFGPASAVSDQVVRFDGATGKLIKAGSNAYLDSNRRFYSSADSTSPVGISTLGTYGGSSKFYVGTRSPEGNISADPGAFYFREADTASRLYQHRGASTGTTGWVDVSAPYDASVDNRGFYAYRTGSNQSLSSGVELTLGMDSKRDDFDGDFTTGSTDSYFTCPSTGRYVFAASAEITLAAAGRAELRLISSVHGRVAEASDNLSVAGSAKPNVTATLYCNTSEIIRVKALQNSGFTATIQFANSHFSGSQIMRI